MDPTYAYNEIGSDFVLDPQYGSFDEFIGSIHPTWESHGNNRWYDPASGSGFEFGGALGGYTEAGSGPIDPADGWRLQPFNTAQIDSAFNQIDAFNDFVASTPPELFAQGSAGSLRNSDGGRASNRLAAQAIIDAGKFVPGTYKTYEDAVAAAATAAHTHGKKYKVEFGGFITGDKQGGYTFTFRSSGSDAGVDPGPIPAGGGTAYHNHTYRFTSKSYNVAEDDYVVSALRGGWTDIMVGPDGTVNRYRGVPTNEFWDVVNDLGGVQSIWNSDDNSPIKKLVPYVVQEPARPTGRVGGEK